MPQISVIIPAYNSGKTISEAINSVLNQTFNDLELIIIDDCSTDTTSKIIEEIKKKDDRVIVLRNEHNFGVSYSRNYGVIEARGEWIAFLDSDDIWTEDKIEKQLEFMKANNAVLSYTASSFIDSEGKPYKYIMQAEEKTTFTTLLKKNLISCSSVMIKSNVMKQIKMPNDNMHEDYYTWLTILKNERFAYGVNEPLLIYRLSTNSKSRNRLKSAKMLYNTYRAVGYNTIISILLILIYSWHSISKRLMIKLK